MIEIFTPDGTNTGVPVSFDVSTPDKDILPWMADSGAESGSPFRFRKPLLCVQRVLLKDREGYLIKAKSTPKTTKGEQKRLLILKAARQCFEQYGYAKTTMDDIAKICRITKSSLFYYYDSKESLFYHSFTRAWDDALSALLEEASAAPIETRIQDYMRNSLAYYQSVVEQFGTSTAVLVETEEQFEQILTPKVQSKIIAFYRETIAEGIKRQVFVKTDSAKLAALLGRIERTFRSDAIRSAYKKRLVRVDFHSLANDICFAVDVLLQGIKNE